MLFQFSVFPFGAGTSIRRHVAKAVEEIEKSGLKYRLTDMGTIVEGEWEPVMRAIGAIQKRLLEETDRVYLTISADARKDKAVALGAKVEAVEAAIGRKLAS